MRKNVVLSCNTVDGKPVKSQVRFFRDLRNASINSLMLIVESQQESTAAMWISPCDQHQPAGVTALHRDNPCELWQGSEVQKNTSSVVARGSLLWGKAQFTINAHVTEHIRSGSMCCCGFRNKDGELSPEHRYRHTRTQSYIG